MSGTGIMKPQPNLDEFEKRFCRRYIIKKTLNAALCLAISLFGASSVLYSVFVNHMRLIDRLRYMTFNGTIFTSVISFIFSVMCIFEIIFHTEITYRWVYFLRLSSAVTEVVILIFVLIASTPLFPDNPDLTSYNGIIMHLVIPTSTVLSFSFNDAPIGKLKRSEPFFGTWFITIYVVLFSFLFYTGILPSSLAPYSVLDFKHMKPVSSVLTLAGLYAIGYTAALLLSILNRKLSWIWFRNIIKKQR